MQRRTHHRCPKTTADGLELMQLRNRLGAGVGIPLTQEWLDQLFEQSGFAIGGDSPAPEMASLEACVEELARDRGDLDGEFVEWAIRPIGLRGDDTVRAQILQLGA